MAFGAKIGIVVGAAVVVFATGLLECYTWSQRKTWHAVQSALQLAQTDASDTEHLVAFDDRPVRLGYARGSRPARDAEVRPAGAGSVAEARRKIRSLLHQWLP